MANDTEANNGGWLRVFSSSPMLRIGAVLVALFVLPLLLIGLLDDESNNVGAGLAFACMGKVSLGVLILGVIEGAFLVVQRSRGPDFLQRADPPVRSESQKAEGGAEARRVMMPKEEDDEKQRGPPAS